MIKYFEEDFMTIASKFLFEDRQGTIYSYEELSVDSQYIIEAYVSDNMYIDNVADSILMLLEDLQEDIINGYTDTAEEDIDGLISDVLEMYV